MRTLVYLFTGLGLMVLAFWAYRENYATQQALKDLGAVQREIGRLQEAISVQRAEWAYLNRPDRLSELAAINFDRLGLLPLGAAQFASTARLPTPRPPEMADGGVEGFDLILDTVADHDIPEDELP